MTKFCEFHLGHSLSITDSAQSLPSSLEGGYLKGVEVHHEGWYVEPALQRVEELAPAILDHLPDMLVGEKVMIVESNGREHGGTI